MNELTRKTRAQLAAMCGIGYMNKWNKDKAAGKRVMYGLLKGAGASRPAKKDELIAMVKNYVADGFLRLEA